MATKPHQPVEAVPAPVAPVTAAAPVIPKGPRSYLAMMLLATLLTPTGLARAYRGEQIGWTRFWIFVGAYGAGMLLFWVPVLNLLIFLALLGLFVWGAIDVFQLRNVKTDALGATLLTSDQDEQFAKGFYILFIVCLILSGVGLLLGLIFGAIIISWIINSQGTQRSNNFDSSEYLRQFEDYSR